MAECHLPRSGRFFYKSDMTIAEEVSHSANRAPIGAVRLVAPSQATSSSSVPMPLYTPAIARTDSLCVALRIECGKVTVLF